MNEQNEQLQDDTDIRAAFERLQDDTARLDTMTPLRRVTSDRRATWMRPGALGLAAAAVVLVVALAVWASDGEEPADTVAAGDPTAQPETSPDSSPGAGVVTTLPGTSWVLAVGTGPSGDIPVLADWPITLTFDQSTLSGTAACNGYGADYSVDGSDVSLGPVAHTEMACQPEVMRSEAAFIAALGDVRRAALLDDQLVLSGPDTELVFTMAAPVPTAALLDQLWLLDTISIDGTATTPRGDPATLVLRSDGTLSGGTGCRTLSGQYVIAGASVQFTSFEAAGDCPTHLTDQDSQVIGVLEGGFTAQVEGDRLIVEAAGGDGLGYQAIDEEPGPTPVPDPDQAAISVGELLETRPSGPVTVSGHLLHGGGGWILCDTLLEGDPPRGCGGRWVVVTNYDAQLDPHTEPPTAAHEAALAAAEASDDDALVAADEVIWTTEAVAELVVLVDDDRVALSAWPSETDLNGEESELLDLYSALDAAAGTIDTSLLRLSPGGVVLALGDQHAVTRSPAELADPAQWVIDAEGFRGRVGGFSALEALSSVQEPTWSAGAHNHCASPPAPILPELRDARQLSIQPTGTTSCIEWFTVDLFLDSTGEVIGIVFDTWEP